MGKLDNKIALVTGAGQGIGLAIVQKYISEGAKCICMDINDSHASQEISKLPSDSAVYIHGDVTSLSDWKNALKVALERFGKLDIVVNNAGLVYNVQPSTDLSEPEFDKLMSVNVKQYFISLKIIAPYFKSVGGGVMVNLSSVSALRPRPNLVWYATSKGAVSATTKGLAAELAPINVRVNAICPVVAETGMALSVMGGVDTPEGRKRLTAGIPLGRFATPMDVANAASFLGSDESSFITGIDLPVDGGRSLM